MRAPASVTEDPDMLARLRMIAGAAAAAENMRPYATRAQLPILDEAERAFQETFSANVVLTIIDQVDPRSLAAVGKLDAFT